MNRHVIENGDVLLFLTYIIIIVSYVTVFAGVLFQPGSKHAPGVSFTQVIILVHTLSIFLRIRADRSMQIFWISVTVALSDTFLMFSIIIIIIIIIIIVIVIIIIITFFIILIKHSF